jgi:hypothetical protein
MNGNLGLLEGKSCALYANRADVSAHNEQSLCFWFRILWCGVPCRNAYIIGSGVYFSSSLSLSLARSRSGNVSARFVPVSSLFLREQI